MKYSLSFYSITISIVGVMFGSTSAQPLLGGYTCRDTQPHATATASGSRRGHSSGSSSQDASVQLGGIVGCMAGLLQRLAYGHSLSAESRGGGRQSNARLFPYLIQLGHYFAGFCSESDLQVRHIIWKKRKKRNIFTLECHSRRLCIQQAAVWQHVVQTTPNILWVVHAALHDAQCSLVTFRTSWTCSSHLPVQHLILKTCKQQSQW